MKIVKFFKNNINKYSFQTIIWAFWVQIAFLSVFIRNLNHFTEYSDFIIFLIFPILKNKVQILTIFSILLIIYFKNPFYKSFYFDNGAGIYFAFVPFFGSPIVFLAILIYFILLIIDLNKDDCIKNRELVENKYYKIFVNVFYYYFVITLLVDFFLCLYFFFTR